MKLNENVNSDKVKDRIEKDLDRRFRRILRKEYMNRIEVKKNISE